MIRNTFIAAMLSLALFPAIGGENTERVAKAILEVKDDIQRDTQALNQLRATIAAERLPLAAAMDSLQKSVAGQRAEAERIRRLRRQGEAEQAALIAEADAVREEGRFILTVATEYARAMEARTGTAESMYLLQQLRPLQETLAADDDFSGMADVLKQLLELSRNWNLQRLGGHVFQGPALDSAGLEHQGRFAAFGPVACFAADDDGPTGLAITLFGAIQPAIYDNLPRDAAAGIRSVVNGAQAGLPVDVTAGDAIKLKVAQVSFFEHVKKGGFVIIPLLAVGALALVLIIWKTIELSLIRVHGGEAVSRVMAQARAGDLNGARQTQQTISEPLGSLVMEALRHYDSPRDHLEEIMHEHVLGCLPKLERHLGILAVLGAVAPLLGLLGTVTGMIHTFQLVTIFGTGDARLLSGGISQALVTTEFGLAIAIPVLLAHAFLARRARTIIATLERTTVTMINDLKVRSE